MDCLVTVLISWVGCRKKEKGAERRNELSPDSFPRRSTIHQQTEQVSYLAHCSLSFYGLPPLRLLRLSTRGWTDLPGSYSMGHENGLVGHQPLRSVSGGVLVSTRFWMRRGCAGKGTAWAGRWAVSPQFWTWFLQPWPLATLAAIGAVAACFRLVPACSLGPTKPRLSCPDTRPGAGGGLGLASARL